MDNQTLFDIAYKGLASQGFATSLKGGSCAYRGTMGRCCAIGWAIPENEYGSHLEGSGASRVVEQVPSLQGVSMDFANDLQRAHDSAWEPANMIIRLETVASKYGLTIPELENNYVG